MISLLLVTPADHRFDAAGFLFPSLEILKARNGEEAIEKLGRNRRIDAVLLLCGAENARILESILEENPAPPPIYVAGSASLPAPARPLEGDEPSELLRQIVRDLESAPDEPP